MKIHFIKNDFSKFWMKYELIKKKFNFSLIKVLISKSENGVIKIIYIFFFFNCYLTSNLFYNLLKLTVNIVLQPKIHISKKKRMKTFLTNT